MAIFLHTGSTGTHKKKFVSTLVIWAQALKVYSDTNYHNKKLFR